MLEDMRGLGNIKKTVQCLSDGEKTFPKKSRNTVEKSYVNEPNCMTKEILTA